MKICIISKNNGWGLTQDATLLTNLLTKVGHDVKFQRWDNPAKYRIKFDLNIHLEMVGSMHLKNATKNWLIPNQEWFLKDWLRFKAKFDKVLCKTYHAVEIFNQLGFPYVEYLGFTTTDIYNPTISRRFECIHVSGNSRFKGTSDVVETWLKHPYWPVLQVYNTWENLSLPELYYPKNIIYHFGKVAEHELRQMQNQCIFHIQPSYAEGFGHVLWEGLAVGGVVITTNAPPMNEIPAVIGCNSEEVRRHHYGTLYKPLNLTEVIESTLNLDKVILQERMTTARVAFVKNDQNFRKRLYQELTEI